MPRQLRSQSGVYRSSQMDTMMIQWILILFGVSVGSSLTQINIPNIQSKNKTTDPSRIKFDLPLRFQSKRQLGNFDFESSNFNSPSLFNAKKINGLSSFDESDNLRTFIPTASLKVSRSNLQNFGTHVQNFDSPNFPSSNYRPNIPAASSESQETSNEDHDASSQVHQTAINNQVTTPHFDNYATQPKYSPAKSNIFPSEAAYKSSAKVQYNPYPTLTEITSSIPIYSPLTQMPVQAVYSGPHYQNQQSATQNTPYKSQYANLKTVPSNTKVYAPLHQHDQQQQTQQPLDASFSNYRQNIYNNPQYTTNPTVEINGKKLMLPLLQLKTTSEFPGYIQAIETTPAIFGSESGYQYKSEPSFGLPFDFANAKTANVNQRPGTSLPFLSSNPSGTILASQTASNSAQYPRFNGANVAQVQSRGFTKIPNDYQEFKLQSQLHFDGNKEVKPKNYNVKPPIYNKPQEIRKDVEIIDKKKPIPPLPKTDDDEEEAVNDDSNEGSKSTDRYFPKKENDGKEDRKHFKQSEVEGDFKPSKSYPFKPYDNKHNKHKGTSHDDDDEDDDSSDDAHFNLAAKYRYSAKSDDEDEKEDDENESAEDSLLSKYKPYPLSKKYKNNYSGEDDEDEEESQKQEKRDRTESYNRGNHSTKKPKTRNEREKNYEEELDESLRKKHSKPKFSHQRPKETARAAINRARSPQSIHHRHESHSKSPKKGRPRTYRDETGVISTIIPKISSEPTKFSSKSDKTGKHSSFGTIPNGTKSPRVIWEDSYKMTTGSPEDDDGDSYSSEEAIVTDSYGNPRKPVMPLTADRTTKASHKSTTGASKDPAVWKSAKLISAEGFGRPVSSNLRALANTKQGFFNPERGRGEIFRSIKGI